MRLLIIFAIICFLSSCGYHGIETRETISVPYFKGDTNGALTNTVIKALATSGTFCYSDNNGHLLLEGIIVADTKENIGYQFDRDPISDQRIHRLVSNEGRRKIIVEILLTDMRIRKVIYGPIKISSFGDYDFIDSDSLRDTSFINSMGEHESSLFFSMGQLNAMDEAEVSSLDPIYRRLALKIVEGISNLPYNKK